MVFNTLSGRFLGLTIVFVMIAEVLIFVPSVSRFRVDYLETRLDLGQLAALALLATPDEAVSDDLEQELLQTAEVLNVALQRDQVRELVLSSDMPNPVDETFDLRDAPTTTLMRDAVRTYFTTGNRIIRVKGQTRQGMEGVIEVTFYEAPLRAAMVAYGLRILYLSLVISIATAALLFFAVRRFIVRPIQRVIDHMTAYRDNPEDSSRIIQPGRGSRELVEAEAALRDMQLGLTGALRQKERLAALGGAVAKISHDLRNMLTTAQLLADRIESSSDPAVRRTAPKLVNSLARAISLCERTLTFGKVDEPAPEIVVFLLAPLVGEVLENEREASATGRVDFRAEIAGGLAARADPDQLFRVLTNLVRNAAQAIEASGRAGSVTVSAGEGDGRTRIRVADTGPGLPPKARENLFRPFSGGVRQGGTGLGLVIAAELVKGHGGSLTLDETAREGTTFVVDIPAPK
ncbi:MAG: HAMP domain-containing histidine kinase [Rhodobacteraceae bacterium]|nr:HAMP domain-containing histidine kinase [Paracoccaceae bacterium]